MASYVVGKCVQSHDCFNVVSLSVGYYLHRLGSSVVQRAVIEVLVV